MDDETGITGEDGMKYGMHTLSPPSLVQGTHHGHVGEAREEGFIPGYGKKAQDGSRNPRKAYHNKMYRNHFQPLGPAEVGEKR